MTRHTLISVAIISGLSFFIFLGSCKKTPQKPAIDLTLPAAQPVQDPAEYEQIRKKLAEAAQKPGMPGKIKAEPVDGNTLEYIRNLAERGNVSMQNMMGTIFLEGKLAGQDYTEAMKWFQKAADQGNAGGQFNLGSMYCEGKGVGRDHSKCMELYRKAGEQGLAQAQFALGGIYYYATDDRKDYAKAFEWFKKAAEQGYVQSQLNTGIMYLKGEGVERNYVEAHKWFTLAGLCKNQELSGRAKTAAAAVKKLMTPEQLIEADKFMVRISSKPEQPAETSPSP